MLRRTICRVRVETIIREGNSKSVEVRVGVGLKSIANRRTS